MSADASAAGICRFLLKGGIPVLNTGWELLLKIEDFCIFPIPLSVVLSLQGIPAAGLLPPPSPD